MATTRAGQAEQPVAAGQGLDEVAAWLLNQNASRWVARLARWHWPANARAGLAVAVLGVACALVGWAVSGSGWVGALVLVLTAASHVAYDGVYAGLVYVGRAWTTQRAARRTAAPVPGAVAMTREAGEDELGTRPTQAVELAPVVPLISQVDEALLGEVHCALRHLADYAWLGDSPLAARLGVMGETQVGRGKALRARLEAVIESLRPPGSIPTGVWPREWQAYAALRLAYVDDVSNREIMARLYVSQSTYARLRRRAVRALTDSLAETRPPCAG